MRTLPHKRHSSLVWFMLLVCTSTSCAASARALSEVLCVGTDGHVAIEYAVVGDCANRKGSTAPDHSTSREQHTVIAPSEHCGDCLDVAIAVPAGPLPEAFLDPYQLDFKPLLLDTLIASSHLYLTHLSSIRVVYDEHFPRRMLRERRSVVLVV